MNQRVQRQRSAGSRLPVGAVYVGRPGCFGNPFTPNKARLSGYSGDLSQLCVRAFREWLTGEGGLWWQGPDSDRKRQAILDRLPELKGKTLACWCRLDKPCHADVLIELANAT